MIRRLVLLMGLIGTVLSVAYVASPFYAAWQLREAIRTSDTATISRKVDWLQVRATLKDSIARNADLLPVAREAGREIRPTLWQRVKSVFGASMLDRFVETYVTPEGLTKLYGYRQTWRTNVRGEKPESEQPWRDRLRGFISRVKRAEFISLTTVVIEIEDRNDARRRYLSVLELMGIEWKLTALRVLQVPSTATPQGLIARN